MDNKLFNFDKSIKCLVNTDNYLNIITDNYKPKTQTEYDGKEKVYVHFYTYQETIFNPNLVRLFSGSFWGGGGFKITPPV